VTDLALGAFVKLPVASADPWWNTDIPQLVSGRGSEDLHPLPEIQRLPSRLQPRRELIARARVSCASIASITSRATNGQTASRLAIRTAREYGSEVIRDRSKGCFC
jgi:hypothetical protein